MKIILDDHEKEIIELHLTRKGGAVRMIADTFLEGYYLPIMESNFEQDVCDIIIENNLGDPYND